MSTYKSSSNTTQNNKTTIQISPSAQPQPTPFNNNNQQINKILTSSPLSLNPNPSNRVTNNILINTRDILSKSNNQTNFNNKINSSTNRHTIAVSDENFENFPRQNELRYHKQQSFESSNNNSSPLSKTPDSSNENWLTLNESIQGKMVSNLTGSMGNLADQESDHEMLEWNATGISGSGQEGGDESADDDLDSGFHNASTSGNNYLFYDDYDDNTTKRLKTFIATTLHNERVYLEKIKKLTDFKIYLEENFNGSETDISVLFSGILQIYSTHDTVAQKLEQYLNSLTDLLSNSSSNNSNLLNSNNNSSNLKTNPVNTRLNQVVGSSRQATNLTPTSAYPTSNLSMRENILNSALNLLANIMEISFTVYLEFLKNYPKSMTILNKLEKQQQQQQYQQNIKAVNASFGNKRKSFIECQYDYNKMLLNKEIENLKNVKRDKKPGLFSRFTQQKIKDPYNIYYNDPKKSDEMFDLTKIFTEEILRRPTKLFEFVVSLKQECLQASNDLPNNYRAYLQSNIKLLFENEASKALREKVFDEINRNIMPKEVRKNEDVVELIENNNDRKLRHLILYGDCLVCCRLKKDKRQLKWFIPIDQLEIFTDEYKSAKSENELRYLKEQVVELRGNLKKQTEENASVKNQQKIKKKLAEQENELAIQSSRLKLIVRANPSLSSSSNTTSSNSSSSLSTTGFFSNSGSLAAAISSSMNNLANLTSSTLNSSKNSSSHHSPNSYHHHNHHHYINTSNHSSSSPNQLLSVSSSNTFVFLFTSDFERNAWMEEINGAIYALKSRKATISLQQSDIESRINSLKKIEEPPKFITSTYTGSLELLVKKIDNLEQPNKVFIAVELKSCGSYLEVAKTRCSDLTKSPVWEEKFNLELQSVDSLRIILYCQTSGKALAIASQELKIDSNVNLDKINCVKLTSSISLSISMKFLSPKKTITRRKTRNRNDIFGGDITELLQREKSTIPGILKDCVEVIETKGIEEVGIYRVSSVVSEVQKMKDFYSKNPSQALNELRQKSPHLAANVLKLYLRELPDPLFTSHLYHRFMSAVDYQVHEFRLSELCRVFNELPEPNKNIILFILTHLLNIASCSDKNMMSLKNLCTLFGPTLMKLSPKDNLQVEDMNKEINESMQQAQVLFYILQLHSDGKLVNEPGEIQQQESPIKTDNQQQQQQHLVENLSKLNIKSSLNQQQHQQKQILDNNNNNITTNQQIKQHITKSSMQTAL